MRDFLKLLYSPDDTPGTGETSDDGTEGTEADGDATDDTEGSEETFDEAPPEEEAEDDTEPEEEGEKSEDEEETKEEEKDEEEVFQGRPTLTDVKAKYPKIFKEFPELREVLFREQKFSEAFGSVEEAQEASSKVQNFDTIEAALMAGDSTPILEQLGANAPDALNAMVENFLPQLAAKSQDLYIKATIPVIEQFLSAGYEYGKQTNNANLMRSMQHAANYIFGKFDIPDPSRRGRPAGPHPAEQRLEHERKVWAHTRFQEASSEVSTEIDHELETEILKGLDPDKKMSDRQRNSLIKNIKDEIDATLSKDEGFRRQMRGLWQRASTANYTKDQRASIKSAFLARAKALVPGVRGRLRAEWFGEKSMKKTGTKPNGKDELSSLGKKRFSQVSGGSSSGKATKPPSSRDVDFSKTSDMDLIEGRFTRRK
jgi:hypothetical protein